MLIIACFWRCGGFDDCIIVELGFLLFKKVELLIDGLDKLLVLLIRLILESLKFVNCDSRY